MYVNVERVGIGENHGEASNRKVVESSSQSYQLLPLKIQFTKIFYSCFCTYVRLFFLFWYFFELLNNLIWLIEMRKKGHVYHIYIHICVTDGVRLCEIVCTNKIIISNCVWLDPKTILRKKETLLYTSKNSRTYLKKSLWDRFLFSFRLITSYCE